jgi:dynein heavy chain 1
VVERRIIEVLGDWDKDKPVHGNRRPRDAIQLLSAYEDRFTKIREDRENMVRAKNALDMTDALRVGTQVSKLDVAMEELTDLRGAWQALMPVFEELDQLRETSWMMVQPRKLRQSVDDLLASLKKLPSQYRSYESYEQTKRLLQNYSRVCIYLIFITIV